jgi:hypothetical protein
MDAGINGHESLENGALELLTATEPEEVLRWAWFVADQGERSCLAIVGTDTGDNSTSVLLMAADDFASCRLAIESAEGFDPITAVIDQKPARPAKPEALASAASVLSQACTRQATNASTPSDGLALWAVAGMAYAAAVAVTKAGSCADLLR